MMFVKNKWYLILLLQFFSVYSFANGKIEEQYIIFLNSYSLARNLAPSKRLLSLSPTNKILVWNQQKRKVLVTTWLSEYTFKRYVKNHGYSPSDQRTLMWVTLVPEVRNFCKQYVSINPHNHKDNLPLRIKQYLGLNPKKKYDLFVQMWVDPKDIFRPCVDPEVDDSECDLNFNRLKQPIVRNVESYHNLYLLISNMTATYGLPWTGYGYTFDWSNETSAVGASEFVLVPKASYEIENVITTSDYCGLGTP